MKINLLLIAFGILFFQKAIAQNNYPNDTNGDFIVCQMKFKTFGEGTAGEFTTYSAFANFYRAGDIALKSTQDRYRIDVAEQVKVNNFDLMYDSSKFLHQRIEPELSSANVYNWKINELGIDFNNDIGLFNINNINLSTISNNIVKSRGFQFAHAIIEGVESVEYVIGSEDNKVSKKFYGASSGVSFTPQELSILSSSEAAAFIIIVTKLKTSTINNKKYYFINNSTALVAPLTING